MSKICFVSHNKGKLREVRRLCEGICELINLDDLDFFNEIEENGSSFSENARIKAKTIFDIFSMACFADDSGLEVLALGNRPGVYSARFASENASDQENINKLLMELSPHQNREARFVTVIAYIDERGVFFEFKGEIKGIIATEQRGFNGFGYDSIFQPFGYFNTFAEMSQDDKNLISHRGIAVRKFVHFLKKNLYN